MSSKNPSRGNAPALLWFRQDLRLSDNPALDAAIRHGGAVIPVFIWAPSEEGAWPPGAASKWWLHHSLQALDAALRAIGSKLLLRQGDSLGILESLRAETGASAVFWNRRYEPAARERDERVRRALSADGCCVETFNGSLLYEPSGVRNKSGRPFQVFTPFLRHCLSLPGPDRPIPKPRSLPVPMQWPSSLTLDALNLLPKIDWAGGLRATWTPGEVSAAVLARRFLRHGVAGYEQARDFPSQPGTSRLSPHLHFGEISVRELWWGLESVGDLEPNRVSGASKFLSELCWREFSHHILYHFPSFCTEPLRGDFRAFPWRTNPEGLRAWQSGRTGFPLVDAGMRQLWQTGWMHNRVRMVVGSFLVKDLLLSWTEGARWFWDTLVDADLAQNSLGWQWVAGCGPDAAPFFRIFNPEAQSRKFDPEGDYIRRWVPELARLDAQWIHRPEGTPAQKLMRAGVQLGENYPFPIVRHVVAREIALEAYRKIKGL